MLGAAMFFLKACEDGFYIAGQVKSGGGVVAFPGFGCSF